ncbi:MAG: hypothetical protein MI919_25100, partial [Holophagales bacterium]|nr:hypothetical protein [Holophagales bacterium]
MDRRHGVEARSARQRARLAGPPSVLLWLLLAACGGEGPAAVGTSDSPPSDRAAAAPAVERAPGAARDIVLVTVDTLRFDAVGFAAGAGPDEAAWRTPTPHLEA